MNQQKPPAAPEIPNEIQGRGAVALSTVAANEGLGEAREGVTQPGASGIGLERPAAPKINAGLAALNAKRKAQAGKKSGKAASSRLGRFAQYKAYANGNPHAGLMIAQIQEVCAKAYPTAPKMDGNLGDKTPAFVDWLCEHHPKDAAIRFAYREIYPSE